MPPSRARNSAEPRRPTVRAGLLRTAGRKVEDAKTTVGRDPKRSRPTRCRCRRLGEAPYDVVAAVDLVLAYPGTRVRRVVHVVATRVHGGVVTVRAGAEDDQVAHPLVALADGLP